MRFQPSPLTGPPADGAGDVDYRLARQAVVARFRRGEFTPEEMCDAHPELVRNARECGDPLGEICPVCEAEEVVLVSYVFGPRLPKHGRCLSSPGEVERISQRKGTFTCYEVEACPACSWNHLRRRYSIAGR